MSARFPAQNSDASEVLPGGESRLSVHQESLVSERRHNKSVIENNLDKDALAELEIIDETQNHR